MRTIRSKLTAQFAALSLCMIFLVWVSAVITVKSIFTAYVVGQQRMRASALALDLAAYYRSYGTWDGVDDLFLTSNVSGGHMRRMWRGGYPLTAGERVILQDALGNTLFDSHPMCMPAGNPQGAADIFVDGTRVGRVVVTSPSSSGQALGEIEQGFLSAVTRAITGAGILSLFLGFSLAVRFSGRISRPIEMLRDASARVARGEFGYTVSLPAREAEHVPAEIDQLISSFNTMSKELREAEERRRELLRDIAHEIRTPLAIIKGNLEAISEGVAEPVPETLQAMSEEVARLTGMVESLSEIDRMESSQNSDIAPRAVSPYALVDRAMSSVQGLAQAKGIVVERQVSPGLPDVFADPDKTQQVFANLLSNAVRYTPEKGRIVIRAEHADNPREVLFKVEDSGPGINPHHLQKVFDRFFRADPSRARSTGGWGLGLAIARSIVEASGGRIWAENVEGGGARFSFTLPRVQDHKP